MRVIAEFLHADNEKRGDSQGLLFKPFDVSAVEISDEAVGVNVIADRLNCALIQSGRDKVTGRRINDWLLAAGYIETVTEKDKTRKIPTDKGIELGIICETRVIRGENVNMCLFNSAAQKYIMANALKIQAASGT